MTTFIITLTIAVLLIIILLVTKIRRSRPADYGKTSEQIEIERKAALFDKMVAEEEL